ncbi:MAG: hypothetical protein WA708_13365 [Acidobacteriaceae bacterium]
MQNLYNWPWVETQVARTIEIWNGCAGQRPLGGLQYRRNDQRQREKAYDQGLRTVERELRQIPKTRTERIATQGRITASFARFSAAALDLQPDAVRLLTDDFLPIGTKLARWARWFDPSLSMPDVVQACRNAWTACGLQPLFGEPMELTASIVGYSLLYPYSDNYLDREDVSAEAKLRFSRRFRERLLGEMPALQNDREAAIWALVALIEEQYPRALYPQVFECLLAIHQAQEESIAQLRSGDGRDELDVLRVSVAKGGSSVLADACVARGRLSEEESRFAFEWGVLLQLGDDLQDLQEDMQRSSVTQFSRAAALGMPLDALVMQLITFGEQVAARMDRLPHGSRMFKDLLWMSWRSLILRAVADSHEFFSKEFLEEAEYCSPFRFHFLRARQERLTSRRGLYATLFDAFLETPEGEDEGLSVPGYEKTSVMGLIAAG